MLLQLTIVMKHINARARAIPRKHETAPANYLSHEM